MLYRQKMRYGGREERSNYLAVKWLGLCALAVKGRGSIPGGGTKIPQAAQHGHKRKNNADVSEEHRTNLKANGQTWNNMSIKLILVVDYKPENKLSICEAILI